ncbi:hypothetical protein [Flavobacterium sp. UBA6135]|uniref:hypothetical protein n=1 Tax=Flavobacterium sp. UBA6135 TaxID=1946553 RepID=UPI0025C3A56F|nr:hypothetical protein [Flavobacterium sp. UBA6135]
MIIGLRKFGKTKELDGQFIKTIFIIIGIPLIPVHSVFYINELNQIDIGINLKSMFKTYFSWLSLLVALIFIFGAFFSNIFPLSSLISILIGVTLAIISFYFFYYFEKNSSENENELRKLYQNAIGMNALPEYFSPKEAENFQKELLMTLKDKFQLKDWKGAIRNNEYNIQQLPLLFVISGFENRINNSKINQDLYIKLLTEYNKH